MANGGQVVDEGMAQGDTHALPFGLPTHMRGLEDMIREDAARLATDPDDPYGVSAETLERCMRLVADRLHRRIGGYYALGRSATNPNCLPAMLDQSKFEADWSAYAEDSSSGPSGAAEEISGSI